MTPGILRKVWPDEYLEATITPNGWRVVSVGVDTVNPKLWQDHLNLAYAPQPTAAGHGWIAAFWDAVKGLDARMLQRPEPDPEPPGAIH